MNGYFGIFLWVKSCVSRHSTKLNFVLYILCDARKKQFFFRRLILNWWPWSCTMDKRQITALVLHLFGHIRQIIRPQIVTRVRFCCKTSWVSQIWRSWPRPFTRPIHPVASETTCVFTKIWLKLLKEIGSKITEVTKEQRATSYLLQRLGIAIQRGNVASTLGTLPQSENLNVI